MEDFMEVNWKYVASGTGGTVFKLEKDNGEIVAIKDIDVRYPKKEQLKRLYREICILRHLDSTFCLTLKDAFLKYDQHNLLSKVRLEFHFMEFDLYTVIRNFNLLYDQIIKIIYQLLMGLKYLTESGIIHRDIKPSNIGVNKDLSLRILDFGLARDKYNDLTEYVVTRWYRPLEIFCIVHYTSAVDIWSAGCILAELFTGSVLFTGKNQLEQCICILKVMGWPSDEMLNRMNNSDAVLGLQLFKSCAAKSNELESVLREPVRKKVLSDLPESESIYEDVMVLLKQMLELDPDKRITACDALASRVFTRDKSLSVLTEMGNSREFKGTNLQRNDDTDEFWKGAIENAILTFKNS